MSYEVLARKWRPQQFADVVGQGHVTQTLANAVTNNRIAHAYLFVGPRGVGKTSMARIFAKALNCQKGMSATPCDECDSCKEIIAGNSMDVLEIDGASNNGVDQVREIRDTIKFAPTASIFKIYIIDEVHMLSTAAFNALLKTLEEPPAHAKFIFATTEPQKILATILSRCQRFDLRRISTGEIMTRLQVIAKAEKVKIDQDALLAVARGSEGGLRDAQSALDQLISFKGNVIAEEDVLSVFGLVSRQTLESVAADILKGEIPAIIQAIADLDAAGKDMQRLLLELLEHFRNVLITLHMNGGSIGDEVTVEQQAVLDEHAALADAERVLRIIDLLTGAESRLRFALSRRTSMETTLIKCARAAKAATLEDILKQLNELKKKVGTEGGIAFGSTTQVETYSTARDPKPVRTEPAVMEIATPFKDRSRNIVAETLNSESQMVDARAVPALLDDELVTLTVKWPEITERAAKVSQPVRQCLLDSRPVEVAPNSVTIGFDPQFEDRVERMSYSRNMKAIQHVLKEFLHRPVTVHCRVLTDDEAKVLPSDHPVIAAAIEREESGVAEAEAGEVNPDSMESWKQDPAVRKVLDTFNGTIVDVRDGSE